MRLSGCGTCTPTLNAQYNYSATQNNGKIGSQQDLLSGEQIAYTYDSLNRLASATGSGWGQSYNYDGFGNLTDQNVTSGTAPALHVTYDPSTNRQTGECADANGNIGAASVPNCLSGYNYDVANRIIAQTPVWGGAPSVAYAYNPSNKRVWKGTAYTYDSQTLKTYATVEEVTFWSISGQKLCTYNLTQYQPGGNNTQPGLVATQTATNYYFGGKLIKNTTGFVTPDRSGSIGKYFPYGQERPSATTDGKEKFATYFRDSETGLDYADQRYHQVGMGRFMTPDPFSGSASANDPGSWNRYAYSGGDPVNVSDPNGLMPIQCGNQAAMQNNPVGAAMMCGGGNIFGNIQDSLGAAVSGGIPIAFGSSNMVYLPSSSPAYDPLGNISSCLTCAPNVDSRITFDSGCAASSELCEDPVTHVAIPNPNMTPGLQVAPQDMLLIGAAASAAVDAAATLAAQGVGYYYATTGATGVGVVLGNYSGSPSYVDAAENIGANAFNISPILYNTLNFLGVATTANQQFISTSVNLGQQIFLSTPTTGVPLGPGFSMELQYLPTIGINPSTLPMVLQQYVPK